MRARTRCTEEAIDKVPGLTPEAKEKQLSAKEQATGQEAATKLLEGLQGRLAKRLEKLGA